MRKNGVDKQWTPLRGGVAAVDGFSTAVFAVPQTQTACDKKAENTLQIIYSSARAVSAFSFFDGGFVDAHTHLSKQYVQGGYTKAVFLSDGRVTNANQPPISSVKANFRLFADACGCDSKEICAVNIGTVASVFATPSQTHLRQMLTMLNATERTSNERAEKEETQNKNNEFAYAFLLGDVLCRMGVVYKAGNECSRENNGAQSKVCCITTDVNITPAMLKKAWDAAVEDTLLPLYTGAERSPNDFACILSSCKAGNYIISATDTEYKKFAEALKRVLLEVAANMANGEGGKRLFCAVREARSKRMAQALAGALIFSSTLRVQLLRGRVYMESLLCALCNENEELALDTIQVYFHSEKGNICVWDYGKETDVAQALLENVLSAKDVCIDVCLHMGNYKATSIARLCKE
jgi:glutamate N-acetyltransferase/amino-acid N-acetyltransferase